MSLIAKSVKSAPVFHCLLG